jgi:signal transduction histidine kinase
MFVLLILLSWQYPYRYVVLYTVITTVVDIVFPPAFYPLQGDWQLSALSVFMLRTVTFLIIGFIVTQLMRVQRQQRRALADANTVITRYAATVENLATSRERNRLARELHDTLAHTLTATSVQLEAANALLHEDKERAGKLMEQALRATRGGLTETRRALQAMRASPLEDLGLVLALQDLAQTTQLRSGCQVSVKLPDTLPDLSPEVEQTLYRVAQEGLENIVRHSNARHVALRIERVNERIQLEVTDDGVGFDAQKVNSEQHFGVRGMYERVLALGGNLQIDSTPGLGTQIRLELQT